MITPPPNVCAYAVELDERQSRRLLEQAARTRATVSVALNIREDNSPLDGVLLSAGGRGLLVETLPDDRHDPTALVSRYCEITLHLDQAQYIFSTTVMDAHVEDQGTRLELVQPPHLWVIQRRKYQRRDLRDDTPVRITAAASSGSDAVAALLNISTGGLACRVSRSDADLWAIGEQLDLEFSVADCPDTFCFPAYLHSKTAGATAGQTILSLEFAPGNALDAQREKLATALYRNIPALADG
ncbi:MAG: hypothetical protein GY842_09665 [bacterium]|nr:hypothetical protein [bacterium]